jgi:hypothetical protein
MKKMKENNHYVKMFTLETITLLLLDEVNKEQALQGVLFMVGPDN